MEVIDTDRRDDGTGVVTFKEDLYKDKDTLAVTGKKLSLLQSAP